MTLASTIEKPVGAYANSHQFASTSTVLLVPLRRSTAASPLGNNTRNQLIDNNIIEREIRPFATARKAWLFSDSVPGADASAVIYSLMLTCRACDVEPYAWLRHVLTELPKPQTGADVSDLLPFNYASR